MIENIGVGVKLDKPKSTEKILEELKEEISRLREELRRIEASLMAERLESIERAMAKNYLELYIDQVEESIDERVECILRRECKRRVRCKENFKNSLEDPLRTCKKKGLKEALFKLDEKLNQIEDALKRALDTPCETCYRRLQKSLRKQRENLQRIAGLKSTAEVLRRKKQVDVSSFVNDVLEPLANPARLTILIAVHQGRRSFSELSQMTGMRGGHLIFHLKRLLYSGLIVQDGRKGDYIITSKGERVIRKLLSIL